jgi:hypothetical protein
MGLPEGALYATADFHALLDGKSELGMDHFEVRTYRSVRRHLILSCVSYLFLAEFCRAHRGGKTRS